MTRRRLLLVVLALCAVAGCATEAGSEVAISNPLAASAPTSTTPTTATTTPTTTTVRPAPTPTTAAPRPLVWVSSKATITSGGTKRDYTIVRPSVVEPTPLPVVVMLAGCCRSIDLEIHRADFRQVAGPAVLVYPDYLDQYWNAGACCGSSATAGVDDVGFVSSVITQVWATQPDASKGPVYLAGYSNGGKLAMELACARPAMFAAVAVYAATRSTGCATPLPMSVLEMAGTEDSETSINGTPIAQSGFTEPTVVQLVNQYLGIDGCTGAAAIRTIGAVTDYSWATCANGRRMELAVYNGVGHDWPETSGQSPSAQLLMWGFFVLLGA